MSPEPQAPDTRWHRLRKHGAVQAAVIFASAAWLVLQVADVFGLPMSVLRLLGVALVMILAALSAYAWVDTRERKVADGKSMRMGGRWRAVVAAAVALLLLGGAGWWLRPRLFGAVRAGAEVIAVLPFNTSGSSVALLGDGLVDLLSANLNEVGHVRAIDPRTTLHRWKQASTNGTVDLDGALEIGRAVGAGSVLLGSVVEAGRTVRIAAELIAVDGGTLAKAEREGIADSVFTLVDGLSVDLLRDVWRAREPLPQLRLDAITTLSPEALRAYMRGEQHFRHSQFDSARVSFEQAVVADSTFALAHLRLSEAYTNGALGGLDAARPHDEAAARFADRLPTPERWLMTGHALDRQGDLAAVDTLRAYVARFPDDARGWYSFADVQFHAWPLLDVTADELYQGFDRALELDPSFAPALQHPIELSILLGDSARFQRYLGALAAVGSARAAEYESAGLVRWSPQAVRLETLDSATLEQTRTAATDPDVAVVPLLRLLRAHTAAVLADSVPQYEEIHAAYDTIRSAIPPRSPYRLGTYVSEAITAASMGRFRSAHMLLDTIRSRDFDAAFAAVLPVYLWGARPADYGTQEVARLVDREVGVAPHTVPYWQAFLALMDGESAQAARILGDAGQPADSALAQVTPALRALIRIGEGDSTANLREAEAGLRRRDVETGILRAGAFSRTRTAGLINALRTQLAVLQTEQPENREPAIRHLRVLSIFEPAFSVLLAPQLAAAYERAGMTADAARTWTRYITVLEQGDAEVQPHVEAARRGLDRLVGESESG